MIKRDISEEELNKIASTITPETAKEVAKQVGYIFELPEEISEKLEKDFLAGKDTGVNQGFFLIE